MNREELLKSKIFNQKWYHKIELLPGLFTDGDGFDNLNLTRELLKKIDLKGKNCLDIGAMDGMMSVILKKMT